MINASEIVKKATAAGFDEAVAEAYKYTKAYIKIVNSKIDSIVEKEEINGSLFVSKDKKVFFSSIDKLDEKSVAATIAQSKSAMKFVASKEDYYGIAEGPFKYSGKVSYSKEVLNYSKEDMIDLAYAAIDSASEKGVKEIAGMLVIGNSNRELATSKSVDNEEINATVRLSLRLFSKDSSMQDYIVGKGISKNQVEKFAKEQVSTLSSAKGTGKIKNGKYDILYLPSPGGSLLSNVNAMACIGSIETGSFLAGKIGKKIANPKLTIYDDGKFSEGINSSLFDSEGYPTQRTPVISNGMLKSYLHNYSTALKYKTKSTGNAGLVQPSPNTLVLEHKNKKSISKLVKEIDKGIIVTNTWYTRFSNYLTGDFSTVPRDLAIYVEKGEPKFAIKQINESDATGIRISDNMIRMLNSIVASSTDSRQSTSWETEGYYYAVPSLFVRDVIVTVAT